MLYTTLKCGIALLAIDTVLASEPVNINIFTDKNDCSTGAIPSSFDNSNCNQVAGPNSLQISNVNGNGASRSLSTLTCQAFTSLDCSGTALNPVIDGTLQSDVNWGTLIGQCAGFIEHIGSWHCQGPGLDPGAIAMRGLEGNITDEEPQPLAFTKIDMVITGVQTLATGITSVASNCPSGSGTLGQCVTGAFQSVVGACLAVAGGFFFGPWKRDEDGRFHIHVTDNSTQNQGLLGNRLYHFLPNDTTHKVSAYHSDGSIYAFSYHFNETAQSHHIHVPFTTSDLSRRQTCNEGDFCLDGDDGYGGTFFDGDSAVWDTVSSDQISGFGQQMFDGLKPTDGDSACANLDDPNGEIASLWYQPANDATFQSDENGCDNFTPAKRADVPDWVGPLAISSGINFVGGIGAAIDNCNSEGGNGAGCVANAVSTTINGFIGVATGAIKLFQFLVPALGGRDGQSMLASDMVHDVSDLFGSGSKLLIHHNSTTGVVRLHASFGTPAGGSKYTRQVDGDTGFAGVFFDANPTEWTGADEMPTSQIPGAANKTLDYMETNNFDSACLDFVDSNSGDTAASLWMQMSNSASFMSTENGCPNVD